MLRDYMTRFISILALILMLGTSFTAAQSARQYFRTGEEFYRSMKYEDAIVQFSRAIEMDPDLDRAYVNRALAYSKVGNHESSAIDFDRALVFNKKDDELYYFSGKEWYLHGNNKLALTRLTQAVELKKNFLEAYQQRAAVYTSLEQYENALDDYLKCLKINEDAMGYYRLAQTYEKLNRVEDAELAYLESISRNDRIPETFFALGLLQYNENKLPEASQSIHQMLLLEPDNLEGILLQSQILSAQANYPKAIEVLSAASAEFPMEPRVYVLRGDIYGIMNQPPNSIFDYTKAINLDPENAELFLKRAHAYEETRQFDRALEDYERLLVISSYDPDAKAFAEEVRQQIYELNREEKKPRIVLDDPLPKDGNRIDIPTSTEVLNISGFVSDESDIQSLLVNGYSIPLEEDNGQMQFLTSVNLSNSDRITIQVTDVYDNSETVIFPIRRTEADPPRVQMIAPYSTDDNTLYLYSDESKIYLEGRVEDESKIANIYVESMLASYIPDDLNPYFSALVDIEDKSKITILVEDEFGNYSESIFWLERDFQSFEDNPMGITWAVFIENSDYHEFTSLEGPARDVSMLRSALSNYQIHNVVHKQNMTKDEMQRFFSIELRDMIRSNRINSLLIWYAGHGTSIGETGYWIPVDATRDDEFSLYNLRQLKASMESYPDFLTHKLVITDACESGPGFYSALRSDIEERDCGNWEYAKLKSSQVFSSAGYQKALDESQFSKTFANVLSNNPGECISIEKVVLKVIPAVENSSQQAPQFGRIPGLEDEDGTFFFVPKGN
jgi:tetratricopeptide (TPR) repeat protein